MRENSRLELPYDPDENIWKYYEVMKVTPIIVEDLMVVLLTIPLTDKSLTMNVYKAHNLPAVNTEVGILSHLSVRRRIFGCRTKWIICCTP